MQLGINLGSINYWTRGMAFLDHIKAGGEFTASNGGQMQFRPDGWPAAYAPAYAEKAPAYNWSMALPFPDEPTEFVIEWKGSPNALPTIKGETVLEKRPGWKRVLVPGQDAKGKIQKTIVVSKMDAADPVYDLHVVPAEHYTLFQTGEIFYPNFLDSLSGFSSVRFMKWGLVERMASREPDVWQERRTPLNAIQWGGPSISGVPLEIMVQLVNRLGVEGHFCIPPNASDALVRETFDVLRACRVQPAIEYANEVWNWGYDVANYALTFADELWGIDSNKDGWIDPKDKAEHVADGWMQYYGYRSKEIAIINRAYGYKMLIGAQTSANTQYLSVWKGADRLGRLDSDFHGWIISGYLNGEFTSIPKPPKKPEDAIGYKLMMANDRAGVVAHLKATEFDGDGMQVHFAKNKAMADARGLALRVYEGNIHLNVNGYAKAIQPQMMQFVEDVTFDPAIAEPLEMMLDSFERIGGEVFDVFALTGDFTVNGGFGLRPNGFADAISTPFWSVIQKRIADRKAVEQKQARAAEGAAIIADLEAVKNRVAAFVIGA